ncbi:hypothetical protein AB1303_07125 [Saccharolobus solfataricus]|uniref:Uncharacterized protein n=1 Tax=Saccharolobus solfataricus TaxID=2287 RepID=A0A157T4T6_SACSO|nr:hypothetical protein [Saccharolobus solfataricus]SAI86463.1 uncharacterised protein [Saccharolobus solfataricus]
MSLLFILRKNNSLSLWNILLTLAINLILIFVIFANIITTSVNTPVLIGVLSFVVWMIVGAIYKILTINEKLSKT